MCSNYAFQNNSYSLVYHKGQWICLHLLLFAYDYTPIVIPGLSVMSRRNSVMGFIRQRALSSRSR